jgi:hypothetical protein
LCAYDGSFAAGLLEAACHIAAEARAVLLIAADLPFPPPLDVHRPARYGFAVALALEPGTELDIRVEKDGAVTPSPLPAFEGNAAAAALPLLAALARGGRATVRLPLAAGTLRVAMNEP